MTRCGALPTLPDQAGRETGKARPAKATRSPLPNRPSGSLWATPRSVTGGGESLERKQQLGRTESGGGDLQAQTEQLWSSPTTSDAEGCANRTDKPTKDGIRLNSQIREFPTPASRDYRSPNLHSYQDRGGQMKGEQLQNFVEHCFLPDPPTSEPGENCWPNTLNWNRLVQISIGSAMPYETLVCSRWALRAWLRQGRLLRALPFSGIESAEEESEDSSESSSQETERERKQRKLWAYRQRTMGWANPLTWTRPAFRRKLNANFVDALMSYPPCWTSVQTACGPEVMELWRSRALWQLSNCAGGQI